MINVIYGDDRVKARAMAESILGVEYEVIEAEPLGVNDMATLFYGTSLFGTERKILVRGLANNEECWELIIDYLDTPHTVVLLEDKLDGRSSVTKKLKDSKNVKIKELKLPDAIDKYAAFRPFDAAFGGRAKMAINETRELEKNGDEPYPLIGLMLTQAIKKLDTSDSVKAKTAIRILAETDYKMKSSGKEGWELTRIALMKIAEL